MEWYEIEACLDGMEDKYKISWEQTRMICYMVAQVNSRKKLKPSDVMSFKWDETTTSTAISNEDITRLKEKANNTIYKLNNGGFSN